MSIFDIKNTADFDALYKDEITFAKLLMEAGILKENLRCERCEEVMTTMRRQNGVEWQCIINKKSGCSSKSVRHGSWFMDKPKLSFQKIFQILLMHSHDCSNKMIQEELRMSPKIAADFRHYFRQLSIEIYKTLPKVGGNGGVVEVDKICVHSRKYALWEKKRQPIWIFGGKCRTSTLVFAEIVKSRARTTLMKVLKSRVKPDTIIYSDESKGYIEVKRFFEDHGVVNQSVQTESKSVDGVHKNGIDEYFVDLKKSIKAGNGTMDNLLEYYVADSVVRANAGDSYIGLILRQIAKNLDG